MSKRKKRQGKTDKAPVADGPGGAIEDLRRQVKAWYRAEVERVAAAHADLKDLDKVDFSELVKRSQVMFACEIFELANDDSGDNAGKDKPFQVEPGSQDYVQLQRVAQAMAARDGEVPESIRQMLAED